MGKKEETGIAPVTADNLPDIYGEYADAGRDEIQITDSSFLKVVEPLSKGMEGIAKPGEMVIAPAMINVGTEITVCIPFSKREWIHWENEIPKWRGNYGPDALDDEQKALTESVGGKPPEIQDTLSFFCVEIDTENEQLDPRKLGGFVASYSWGRFKVGKQLAALRNHFEGPPIFAVFTLRIEETQNKAGQKYHVAKAHGVGGLRNPDTIKAVAKMHSDLKTALG